MTPPRSFDDLDLASVNTPALVLDVEELESNLARLADLRERAGVRVLLALKAFTWPGAAELVGQYLDGTAASGLWEARLGHDHYGGEVHTYVPGLKPDQIGEINRLSDHVVFNSLGQLDRFADLFDGSSIGLRINPEHSEGANPLYDPCGPGSRLGVTPDQLVGVNLATVDGFHVHALCDHGFDEFDRLLAATEEAFGEFFGQIGWINLGGGQLLTADDYPMDRLVDRLIDFRERTGLTVYLEPGTAVALNAGALVAEVLDVGRNDGPFALVDASATCHMPDVIEAPYTPEILGAESVPDGVADSDREAWRLGGPTCLAGDIIGRYRFEEPLEVGQRLVVLDQGYYTLVKSSTFNGTPLPSVYRWWPSTGRLELDWTPDYEHFVSRLGLSGPRLPRTN